jgi:hypothetical protein
MPIAADAPASTKVRREGRENDIALLLRRPYPAVDLVFALRGVGRRGGPEGKSVEAPIFAEHLPCGARSRLNLIQVNELFS